MSTKIYNGFRINSLSAMMQAQFIRELKEKLSEKYENLYYQTFAEKSLDFIDRLSIMDQEGDFDKLQKALKTYYLEQMPIGKLIDDARFGKTRELDVNRMHQSLAGHYTVRWLFLDILKEDTKASEIYPTIMNSDTYFKTSLVMFPINKSKTLLMTFPDAFTSILREIADTDKVFADKYGLEEYHYQNQTDRPDRIDAAAWGRRKRDWDLALPSGVPLKDGICIDLIEGESFVDSFFFDKVAKKVFKLYPSRTERVDALGREKAFDAYYDKYAKNKDECDYHEVMELNREFKKKLAEGDADAQEIFDTAWKQVNGCLPEITQEDLDQKKILDWFPNYKKSLNLEEEGGGE